MGRSLSIHSIYKLHIGCFVRCGQSNGKGGGLAVIAFEQYRAQPMSTQFVNTGLVGRQRDVFHRDAVPQIEKGGLVFYGKL